MFSTELARCDLCGGLASYRLAALAATALGGIGGLSPYGEFDACVDCATSTIDRGDAIETERILIHA